MENKEQYTLGKLIYELEKLDLKSDSREIKEVRYDFAYFAPTILSSWRGSYNQLALGYSSEEDCKLDTLLRELRNGLDVEFTGWKGGKYRMNEDTTVWVAQPNESCNTGIIGVLDKGYKVILLTTYFDY